MTSRIFKKTLFISLLGHITVFSIFGLSFGNRIFKTDYASVFFLGSILQNSDLSRQPYAFTVQPAKLGKHHMLAPLEKNKGATFILPKDYKPAVYLSMNSDKKIFIPKDNLISSVQKKKETTIMFYPPLPYHFLLYFKDRQRVHIEVMFKIISTSTSSNILIKRKISSGNLEADLLSMRYIGHYLFIQQAGLIPNSWQTVKIDLSPRND